MQLAVHSLQEPTQLVSTPRRQLDWTRFNLGLALAAAFLLIGYVVVTNASVSRAYLLNLRKSQLNQINASLAQANQVTSYQLGDLLNFANRTGMVESKVTDSMLKDTGVALSHF